MYDRVQASYAIVSYADTLWARLRDGPVERLRTRSPKKACHILSSVNSSVQLVNHNIASFLVNVLKPISTKQFTIKDSFTFVDWVKAQQHNNEIMCSFDICSFIFTNVPLDETIEISLTKFTEGAMVILSA